METRVVTATRLGGLPSEDDIEDRTPIELDEALELWAVVEEEVSAVLLAANERVTREGIDDSEVTTAETEVVLTLLSSLGSKILPDSSFVRAISRMGEGTFSSPKACSFAVLESVGLSTLNI